MELDTQLLRVPWQPRGGGKQTRSRGSHCVAVRRPGWNLEATRGRERSQDTTSLRLCGALVRANRCTGNREMDFLGRERPPEEPQARQAEGAVNQAASRAGRELQGPAWEARQDHGAAVAWAGGEA